MLKISVQALAAFAICALLVSCDQTPPEVSDAAKPKPLYVVPAEHLRGAEAYKARNVAAQTQAAQQGKPAAASQSSASTAQSSSASAQQGKPASSSPAADNFPPSAGLVGVADPGSLDSVANYATGEMALSIKKRSAEKLKAIQDKHDKDLDKASRGSR